MNAIKHTKLTMALGAALVAGAVTANAQAQEQDFAEFSRQARAEALAETTAQPGAEERVRQLRGALDGARVIAGLPDADEQRRQAQASIRSEQLSQLQQAAPAQIAGSLAGSRVVAGLPSAEEYRSEAVTAILAEQINELRRQAPGQLQASLAGAHVMNRVAEADPAGRPGSGEWSVPEVKFKPLLDMSILHFSFRK